jgi:hypothetical protein
VEAVQVRLLAGACGVALTGLIAPDLQAAKLIEFGWDEPDTGFMRQHIREMEQTPFDGCVFHLTYTKEDGKSGNFTWECWGEEAFSREQLWHAVDDLRTLDSETFTENFLRFNVTPGNVDWFDDFSAILSNARLAAEIARAARCPGILFDIEQYNSQLFSYQAMRDKDAKSFDEYAAQVRKRGAEVMEAFQEPFPDMTVFLTFGYCLPWYQAGSREKLPEASYGLLAPFFDGMLEAANEGVTFVDGHEASYPYQERAQFETARRVMTQDLLPLVADPETYLQHLSVAFGVWMDCNWRNVGWATGPFAGNHFLPMQLKQSVEAALELCDEYVWLYSETPRWWSAEGPQKLPRAYVRAVRTAKEEARGGN